MAPTRAIDLKQIFQIRKERRLRQLRILHYILSRRKKFLQLCLTLLVVTSSKPETPLRIRSCHCLERTTNWWNNLWASYSEKRFRNTFRMPRNVFTLTLGKIEPEFDRFSRLKIAISAISHTFIGNPTIDIVVLYLVVFWTITDTSNTKNTTIFHIGMLKIISWAPRTIKMGDILGYCGIANAIILI